MSGPSADAKLEHQQRDEKLLRFTLSMLCNYVWTKSLRPGEHLWSIPVDKERDFDCILSDAISELVDLRARAIAPSADAMRALVERLKWARSFIEYARVQLQPGETQPSDPFPRQSAADLAMSEIDGVIDALHSLTIPPEQTKEHGV